MIPKNNTNTIIKILYVFSSPSAQNDTVKADHKFFTVSTGAKEATNNAAVKIPEPSDNRTLFVASTITIAINGGNIETHVPIILISSLNLSILKNK